MAEHIDIYRIKRTIGFFERIDYEIEENYNMLRYGTIKLCSGYETNNNIMWWLQHYYPTLQDHVVNLELNQPMCSPVEVMKQVMIQ